MSLLRVPCESKEPVARARQVLTADGGRGKRLFAWAAARADTAGPRAGRVAWGGGVGQRGTRPCPPELGVKGG